MKDIANSIAVALSALRKDRLTIDDRIAALELAHETLCGEKPTKVARATHTKEARSRTRDSSGVERLLAFLTERNGAGATIPHMKRATGGTTLAIRARVSRLVREGKAKRISRGIYGAVNS